MAESVETSNGDACEHLKRKVVDTSGRLGSLYDAFVDRIVHRQALQSSRTSTFSKPIVCRIFSGSSSKIPVDYLENMDFDDAMRQSLMFGLATPSGVSALINHDETIDENTRFLYYSYRSIMEELTLTSDMVGKTISQSSVSSIRAPYFIDKIAWGFEVLCVIPMAEHLSADEVDILLRNISDRLKTNTKEFNLSQTEERQIARLINVAVFGPKKCIPEHHMSFSEILKQLKQWLTNESVHDPLVYSMHSARSLFHNPKFSIFIQPPEQIQIEIGKLQHTLIYLAKWANKFRKWNKNLPENLSGTTLNEILRHIDQRLQNWLMMYNEFQDDLRKMIVYAREYQSMPSGGTNILSNQKYSIFKQTEVETFDRTIEQLLEKARLIETLNADQFQYMNVPDICIEKKIPVTRANIDAALKSWDLGDNYRICIWYASDPLRRKHPDKWKPYYQKLTHQRASSGNSVRLVYADFSQCEHLLSDFEVVQLPMPSCVTNSNHQPVPTSCPPPPTVANQPPARKEINVLLLGETGVGKSTFINAFVNYLVFDSLQQAEQSQPVVLIPISFLMTTGHDFEEVIVKFGNVDENEDFEHEGQSVTQHCRSYVFDLNDRLRLRLIDTPGINDTRGIDQDNKNMQHILTYINNLSHLNAVCLLLKPNNSKLTTFFRSCINQLFTYLTPLGYRNVIFCFTNARATFFAPGDTGPLLRKMIKEQQNGDIPFGKANTFCFDSESFRYLVAKRFGVTLEDFYKGESTTSWVHSVAESFRLLEHILTIPSYHMDDWQSPKKAVLEIMTLARPLMETVRLILFNLSMHEMEMVSGLFELKSSPMKTDVCFNCASSTIVRNGPLFITQYQQEIRENGATQRAECRQNHPTFSMEYIITYTFIEQNENRSSGQLVELYDKFLNNCYKLSYFLRRQKLLTVTDPFVLVLEQFLKEEEAISDAVNSSLTMNTRVRQILNSIKDTLSDGNNENCGLAQVNSTINELKEYKSVQKQLLSTHESRRLKMNANERLVTIPSIKNKQFAELVRRK